MERHSHPSAEGLAPPDPGNHPVWLLLLLGLVIWQGWLTLTLFGPDQPWRRLLNDEPILSGRHPLHLYHGYLGARSLVERGTLCCYDPSFQAGYPKTPVFDSGSRPGELFLLCARGAYRPAAYKIGLAACCLLVPVLLATAARAAGFNRCVACLSAAVGMLVWWGTPCRALLEAGDLDLLLAGVAALAQVGLLIRFDREPGLGCWVGVLASGYLGWFAHPVLFAVLLPLALVYYLSVGARHHLAWHLALLGGLAGAVASNIYWLTDWVRYWWLRAPLTANASVLRHRTVQTLWEAPLWGDLADRVLAACLLVAAAIGVWLLNANQRRVTARLLGLGTAGFLVLAVAGIALEPVGCLGTSRLVVIALLFAVLPAVHAGVEGFHYLVRWTGSTRRTAFVVGGLLLAMGVAARQPAFALVGRFGGTTPLAIGLGPERSELIAVLREHTTPEARILWEDCSSRRAAQGWTALLPVLTGQEHSFLGGLDSEANIEHTRGGFVDHILAGRPLNEWSDEQLESFCERYNVGWVVCWSPQAVARFRAWQRAAQTATLSDGAPGCLFALERQPSFALKGQGQAKLVRADCQRIALGDVVPDKDGKVVLSFHYQAGLRASPGRVVVEQQIVDPNDPIAFVRLRLSGPVARVTLTWDKR